MADGLRALAAVTLVWAVAALLWQVRLARGRGRIDHSRARGSAWHGVVYGFTVAMLPSHKESVRLHKLEFGIGMVLHAGVLAAVADVLLLVVAPRVAAAVAPWLVPLVGLAVAAACALIVRRARSPTLRAMSAPDDFVAISAVLALLVATLLHGLAVVGPAVLLGCAALFFAYLPLGKLRHAIFFFVARADLGRRLGRRGVFSAGPVPIGEQSHAGRD